MNVIAPACRRAALVLACLLVSTAAAAQGFSALVSPPRFEASVKPGSTYRNVIEINNVSAERAHFVARTADWQLDAGGSAVFSEALADGSCRPWVGIEAAEINIGANGKRRYRFEVAVPADAPSGECRFAIMIEGDPQAAQGAVAVPVAGRIGVIVYLAVADAKPRLELAGHRVQAVDGHAVPVLSVRNQGNAHGRLEGLIDGVDAKGRRLAFAPSSLPILAGETRAIALTPQADDDNAPAPVIAYPLRLKGRLDVGSEHFEIEAMIGP